TIPSISLAVSAIAGGSPLLLLNLGGTVTPWKIAQVRADLGKVRRESGAYTVVREHFSACFDNEPHRMSGFF
ncbi:MAG: hypothetical protein AAFM91_08960, partial [Pseudomonadota bacterium]